MTEARKKQKLAALIVATTSYFGVEVQDDVIKMYIEDLLHLDETEIEIGFRQLRRDTKLTRFNLLPIPAKVIEAVRPEVRPEDIAVDFTNQICRAIERHGIYWPQGYTGAAGTFWQVGSKFFPTFHEAVEAELGPQAFTVINRLGGWQSLHDGYYNTDPGIFKAQLRRGVEATVRVKGLTFSQMYAALPDSSRREQLTDESNDEEEQDEAGNF